MKNIIFSNLIYLLVVAIKLSASTTAEIQSYYYTNNNENFFSNSNSATGIAFKLNNQYTFNEYLSSNVSLILLDDLGNKIGGSVDPFQLNSTNELKAYIGTANLNYQNHFFDLTLGRQKLNTPLVGSIDMYLNSSDFEALQIKDVPLIIEDLKSSMFYISKLRALNTGTDFVDLNGNNLGLNLSYELKSFITNFWFYNIDEKKYDQIYLDGKYEINNFIIQGQYAETMYDSQINSNVYGLKVSLDKEIPVKLSLSFNRVENNFSGHLQLDSLYTSSWNTFTSDKILGNSYKVDILKKFSQSSIIFSYALYDNMHEFDTIYNYSVTNNISLKTAFTNTEYNEKSSNALELSLTYKF
jgi:hypothetical protein